ncbi:TlpA family protein disulfide reductase [Hymenobacter properus]|uniref:TlpA family protein disulfide reductase n=1 Tax=Hymenobacter properus TaxID=2791026 RepID=A0A931FJG0_9BACT|nr:TlpA disulfide reductase family protein [Hymenobacter properus]MBF9140490.1 TlpA family protein disulfide reductase [Hymenobacter properus]MBR7719297.1 TlpA family protein disulfide reductase [Microvirga sp. SRT04]
MMRPYLWTALLLAALPAAAQRAKVTKTTVFKDVDGHVISKDEFKAKLSTGQFAVYDHQSQGRAFTSISLRPADTPDAVRTQALSPARTFGTAAPAFSGVDVRTGQPVALADLRGKVVVVNFWFIRCPYCIEEMPNLKTLTAAYGANPDVVFVSVARDKPEALRKFLATRGDFGFAVLPEGSEVARQFGVLGYPTTAVIDRQGRFTYDQEYTDNLTRLREAIGRAL